MTYGLDRALPAGNARPADTHGQAAFRRWRALDERSRLQLVERALKPANDLIDAYPIAL